MPKQIKPKVTFYIDKNNRNKKGLAPIKANIRTVLSTYRMFKSTRYFGNCQIPVFSLGVFQLCIIKSMKIWTQLVIEVARE